MKDTIIIDLHDKSAPAEARDLAKFGFAVTRLSAKEAFKKQGGDFEELITYALYDCSEEDQAVIHIHTPPLRISSKTERRRVVCKYSPYDKLDEDDVPFTPEIGKLYLIANYGSDKPKIVDFTKEFFTPREVDITTDRILPKGIHEELALIDLECQPLRLQPVRKSVMKPRKKQNLVRKAVREIIPNISSSNDEQSGPKKPKTPTDEDEAQKSSKTTRKSKHQGKAKTFKRKTQRRGRV